MHHRTAPLAPALLEQVLARLGFERAPEPDLAGLDRLYGAWCARVPFDNVLKLIHLRERRSGPLPGEDPAEFFTHWLRWGTGGNCWSGNNALQALLAALGFRALHGIGTMLTIPEAPPNHGTVGVELAGERWLVDASILHAEPLRLAAAETTAVAHPAWGASARPVGARWHVLHRQLHRPEGFECRIEHFDASATTFHDFHELTREWSPFNHELHARRLQDDTLHGIAFGQRVRIDGDGTITTEPLDDAGRRCVLVEEFGMAAEIVARLPPDEATPPRPGTRTAAAMAALPPQA